MAYYTTKIGVLKRALLNFAGKISSGLKRPFAKFTADMCYGAMASKSCVISDIAHALQEDTKKINTVERLTRNLCADIPEAAQGNYLNLVKQQLPSDVVVHIDDSDVVKPKGKAFEGICRVRDGSRSTEKKAIIGIGYYVTEATALTKSCHPASVFSEIWTTESPEFTSGGQFAYTRKAIEACTAKLGHVTFVMDRGYDNNDVFRLLDHLEQDYVIRLKMNRNVRVNGKKHSILELCAKYRGKYTTKVIYHGRTRKAKLTCIKGVLSGSERALSIILVFGLSDHPMVLATNLDTSTKNSLICAMRRYFSRWRIEEYFRCKKQMFDFENFRVRSLKAINSLNFFLSSCMLFLALLRETRENNQHFSICIEAANPIRPKVFFFYYRLIEGLYSLLSKSHSGIRGYFKPLRPDQNQLRIRGFT